MASYGADVKSEVVRVLRPQRTSWYNDSTGVAAGGGCSQHGTSCRDIYASVILRDKGSDNIRWAVCRRGLIALKGDDRIPDDDG
jgi:hypothetical protein